MGIYNLFMDGFDHYTSLTTFSQKWQGATPRDPSVHSPFLGSGHAIGSAYADSTGNGMYLPSGAGNRFGAIGLNPSIGTGWNFLNMGVERQTAAQRTLFSSSYSGGLNWRLVWHADGSFELFNSSNSSMGSSSAVAPGTTYYAIALLIGNVPTLYINGTSVFTWGSAPVPDGFTEVVDIGGDGFGSASTGCDYFIDDMIIANASGVSAFTDPRVFKINASNSFPCSITTNDIDNSVPLVNVPHGTDPTIYAIQANFLQGTSLSGSMRASLEDTFSVQEGATQAAAGTVYEQTNHTQTYPAIDNATTGGFTPVTASTMGSYQGVIFGSDGLGTPFFAVNNYTFEVAIAFFIATGGWLVDQLPFN